MTGRTKRAVQATALLLSLSAFFVFGFLSGRIGRHDDQSVLDEAAARISTDAAGATDRQALERAAIQGMLGSLASGEAQVRASLSTSGLLGTLSPVEGAISFCEDCRHATQSTWT